MRFGIKTAPQHTSWADMLAVWQAADDIEVFDSAWNFDHFEPIFSDRTGPCLEGWSMLAAMATATKRIRIGCQVTGMPYRHPSVLANIAATIDVISGGRLDVGLGAGWNQQESDMLGITLPPLKERFDRFDEGVEMIVKLLTVDEPVANFSGRHYSLHDARCEPKPIQRPHPPIAIGGNGPTRTLRTVAKWAQHWNSLSNSVDEWKGNHDVLLQRCAEIGRNPQEIACSVNLWWKGDAGELAAQAAAYGEAGVDIGIVILAPPHTPEPLAAIASALAPLLT
jgi:F420-dependent oxidoreductase-like protein